MPNVHAEDYRRGERASVSDRDRAFMAVSAGNRLALIAQSYARLTGRSLVTGSAGMLERAMWESPRAIVALGIEPRPRLFYGNRKALRTLAMPASEFIGTIASDTAEPALREERSRILAGLARNDIVDLYGMVGLAADGRRFTISDAQLWTIVDANGGRHGQAATFAEVHFLDRA